jgi:hypothetical protein
MGDDIFAAGGREGNNRHFVGVADGIMTSTAEIVQVHASIEQSAWGIARLRSGRAFRGVCVGYAKRFLRRRSCGYAELNKTYKWPDVERVPRC